MNFTDFFALKTLQILDLAKFFQINSTDFFQIFSAPKTLKTELRTFVVRPILVHGNSFELAAKNEKIP